MPERDESRYHRHGRVLQLAIGGPVLDRFDDPAPLLLRRTSREGQREVLAEELRSIGRCVVGHEPKHDFIGLV